MGWTELSIGLFDCQTAHRTIQVDGSVLLQSGIFSRSRPETSSLIAGFRMRSPQRALSRREDQIVPPFFWRAPPVAPVLGDSPDFGLGMGVSIVFPDAV